MKECESTYEENERLKCEIGSENAKLARGIEDLMQGFEEILEECKGGWRASVLQCFAQAIRFEMG